MIRFKNKKKINEKIFKKDMKKIVKNFKKRI